MNVKTIRSIALLLLPVVVAGCEATGSQPVGYQAELRLAEQFLASGSYERAYDVFDGVGAKNDRSAVVQLALGESYMRSLAFLKAERAFKAAAALGAEHEANVGLARIALARNNPEQARAIFDGVLLRDPNNTKALNGVGVALDLQGWHDGAQNHYRKALAIDPALSEARNNLGLSLIFSGDFGAAEQVLRELAASELDNRQARQNLAVAMYLSGRRRDALELAMHDVAETTALALFRSFEKYRRS